MSLIEDINSALDLPEEGVREERETVSYKGGLPAIRSYVNVRGLGYEQGRAELPLRPNICLNNKQQTYTNDSPKIRLRT